MLHINIFFYSHRWSFGILLWEMATMGKLKKKRKNVLLLLSISCLHFQNDSQLLISFQFC